MNLIRQVSTIGALGALLTACGSGGGSDYGPNSANNRLEPLTLTQNNAVGVSRNVVGIAFEVDEITAGDEDFIGVIIENPVGKFDISEYITTRLIGTEFLLNLTTLDNSATGVVIENTNQQCLLSGSVTLSGEIQDETRETITRGDKFTLQFNDCNDDEGIILSGVLSITFTNVDGVGNNVEPPFTFSTTIDMANFSVASGGETVITNGSMFVNHSSQGQLAMSSITGSSLSIRSSFDSVDLTNFDIDETINTNTTAYERDASGSISHSGINGTVNYFTEVPFVGIGKDYPDSGQMLIRGANNSSIRIVANDNINVTLEVDNDGDATVDQTIATTWDELEDI